VAPVLAIGWCVGGHLLCCALEACSFEQSNAFGRNVGCVIGEVREHAALLQQARGICEEVAVVLASFALLQGVGVVEDAIEEAIPQTRATSQE